MYCILFFLVWSFFVFCIARYRIVKKLDFIFELTVEAMRQAYMHTNPNDNCIKYISKVMDLLGIVPTLPP